MTALPDTYRLMVTGHRALANEPIVRALLRRILIRTREKHNDFHAVSGMALGADLLFAEEAVALGIPFIAALPFEGQTGRWPGYQVQRHAALVGQAAVVVRVWEQPGYTSSSVGQALYRRNLWMLDHSDATIGVWNGAQSGGTWNCIKEAVRRSRRIVRIIPQTGTVERYPK